MTFSLLILSLYFGIGEDLDPQSVASTSTLLYFICAICGYGAAAYVPSLTMERSLFYRELADGCYSVPTYYASKFVEEGIMCTVTSLIFCALVHFACKLQGNFGVFLVVYYLTSMTGIVLAYAVAAIVPTWEAANAVLPTYVTICMYFGGLFIVFDKIPPGWAWFSWTSFLRCELCHHSCYFPNNACGILVAPSCCLHRHILPYIYNVAVHRHCH